MPGKSVTDRRDDAHGVTYTVRDPAALKAALKAAGVSHKAAGEAAGVHASMVSHLTAGRRGRVYKPVAEALAQACGLPVGDLFDGPSGATR